MSPLPIHLASPYLLRHRTVQFHPDKATGSNRDEIEAIYVNLKLARDTLVDPVKRFAYDRFGPEILQWRHCKTLRDFVLHGVQKNAIPYIGSMFMLVVLPFLGYLEDGKFWRYLVVASLLATDVYTTTRPEFPSFLTGIVNPLLTTTRLRSPYLPFQMLAFLRRLSFTFFIALNQLSPLLRDPNAGLEGDRISSQHLDRLDALAKATYQEVARLLGLDLVPFFGDQGTMRELRKGLKEWLMQNAVRNDPEVSQAVMAEMNKRRPEGGVVT
jgi:hypothetical protein